MTGVALADLLVEAADPAEAARFWRRALGGKTTTLLDGSVRVSGSGPELTFYPRAAPGNRQDGLTPDQGPRLAPKKVPVTE
jgi:hypothetical protein